MSIANPLPDVSRIVLETLPHKFSRRCSKLGPARTFLTMLHMTIFNRRGYQRTVKQLLTGAVSGQPLWKRGESPSASAVSQGRKKVHADYCEQAYDAIYGACTKARQRPSRTYKGLQICALDGTNMQLPRSDQLSQHFGHPTNAEGVSPHPMAGLVLLWNVSCTQPIAFSLTPYGMNERAEGQRLFDRLPKKSILITDRGYPSIALFEDLCQRKQAFLMRIKKNFYKGMSDHIDKHGNDCLFTFQPKDHHGTVQDTGVTLRLLTFTLPSGEREVLACNVWAKDGHHAAALTKLYTARWSIETAFKDMKIDYALESFSGTHPNAIIQELYAVFIFVLLRSELDAAVRIKNRIKTKDCDSNAACAAYQFNQAMICDTVHELLRMVNRPKKEIVQHLKTAMDEIYRCKTKTRPGRMSPRKNKQG